MASLNNIVDYVAGALGDPFNYELKGRIKLSIKAWRAQLIKQDIERHGHSGTYLQRTTIPMIKVDAVDSCLFAIGCHILRSENKIPTPIRLNGNADFKFVGSPDGEITFTQTEFEELKYTRHNKYTSNIIRYKFVNGYMYVFNAKRIKLIGIETAFESPEEAINMCNSNNSCYNDDMEFPLPLDMLEIIVKGMISGEFTIKTDNQAVDIDDTPKFTVK